MNHPIRRARPIRSEVTKRAQYREYKQQLRTDFKTRCGYCDDTDIFSGGIRGFHIDHFAPQAKFEGLKTEYTNLVYSCSYCNGAKSDKWYSESHTPSHNGLEGFVDPCTAEFDEHFLRTPDGQINGVTDLGRHIVRELNLGLLRHQLIWKVHKLEDLKRQLMGLLGNTELPNDDHRALSVQLIQTISQITAYTNEIFDVEQE